jgi:hypothetical protein
VASAAEPRPLAARCSWSVGDEASGDVPWIIGPGPSFASDGPEVGEVADLLVDEEGQITQLRMKTGALLGIGTRTIQIPDGAFIVLRGAVVLEMPTESIVSMPERAEER